VCSSDLHRFVHQFLINIFCEYCGSCSHQNQKPRILMSEIINTKKSRRKQRNHYKKHDIAALHSIPYMRGRRYIEVCTHDFVLTFLLSFVCQCNLSHRTDRLFQISFCRTDKTAGTTFHTFQSVHLHKSFFVVTL